jgi:branched-chain amino acid transport system permease protein
MHIVDLIISGVLTGAIYAIIAIGLTLIFGVSRILNVAHGDFLMLGSILTYWVYVLFRQNPFFSLLLVFPIFFGVGGLLGISLIRRISKEVPEVALTFSILATLGLSMIIEDSALFGMGYVAGKASYGVPFSLPPLIIFGVSFSSSRLLSLLCIIVIVIILRFFILKTFIGKTIRAFAQDREMALGLAADEINVLLVTCGLGTALAAAAGVFIVMITAVSPTIGIELTFKALSVIILGGMGSFVGSLVGAFLLGLAESFTVGYISPEWSPIVAVLLLITILLVRPEGLFRR